MFSLTKGFDFFFHTLSFKGVTLRGVCVCVCVCMIPYNNIIYKKHNWQVCIIPHNGAFWKGCITPFVTPQHLVVIVQHERVWNRNYV
jgi:hypothetical protein